MDNTNFNDELKKGRLGEQLLMDYLDRKGTAYADKRSDKLYQALDIDLLVGGKAVEVKTNYTISKYQNIVIELILTRNGVKKNG